MTNTTCDRCKKVIEAHRADHVPGGMGRISVGRASVVLNGTIVADAGDLCESCTAIVGKLIEAQKNLPTAAH